MKIIIVPIVVFSWYLPFLDRAKNVANQLVHPGLSIYLMFNSRLLQVGGWATSLKNDGVRQLGLYTIPIYSQYMEKTCSKPPTRLDGSNISTCLFASVVTWHPEHPDSGRIGRIGRGGLSILSLGDADAGIINQR